MASKYESPADYLGWYLSGNKLVLITTYTESTTKVVEPVYRAIDEDQTDGLLIRYAGSITRLDINDKDIHKSEPDVPKRIHGALIDYVLSKLYAAKSSENEGDAVAANRHYIAWKRRISLARGGRPRDTVRHLVKQDKRMALM